MFRVPELARSAIRDPSERAATGRPPVGRENRLPHHEDAHLLIGVPSQPLLGCGGPPQASWSSRRQQQDETWNDGFGIERFFEFSKISFRKRDNRLLSAWRRARTPQIGTRKQ